MIQKYGSDINTQAFRRFLQGGALGAGLGAGYGAWKGYTEDEEEKSLRRGVLGGAEGAFIGGGLGGGVGMGLGHLEDRFRKQANKGNGIHALLVKMGLIDEDAIGLTDKGVNPGGMAYDTDQELKGASGTGASASSQSNA